MKLTYQKETYEFNLTKEMISRLSIPEILQEKSLKSVEAELDRILLCWQADHFRRLQSKEMELSGIGKKILDCVKATMQKEFSKEKSGEEEVMGNDDFELGFIRRNEKNFFAALAVYYLLERMKENKANRVILHRQQFYSFFLRGVLGNLERTSLKNVYEENRLGKEALQKELAKKDKVIEEKKQQHSKDQTKIEELNQANKKLKNNKNHELESENALLTKELENLKEDLSNLHKSTVSSKKYEQLNEALQQLQLKFQAKSKDYANLLEQLEQFQEWDLLKELKNYLKNKGLTEELMLLLYPYLEDFQKNVIPVKSYSDGREQRQIGYCVIQDQEHFFCHGDTELFKIYNIPESTYLCEGQFICVNQDYCFLRTYDNVYEAGELHRQINKFENARFNADGELQELLNPKGYKLVKDQVVGVNVENEVVHVYKKNKFNADTALKSALIRGQKVYFVIKVLAGGYLLRDINTEKEIFVKDIITKENIGEYGVIFLHENRVVKYMEASRFYTAAECYTQKRWGIVEEREHRFFINLENYERIKINKVPDQVKLESGDFVAVDEFANYIGKRAVKLEEQVSIEKRVRDFSKGKQTEENFFEEEEPLEIFDKGIVIVGDASMENAYKYAFIKKGLSCSVVDGCDAWHKITKVANGANYIVYVTDYAKHSHYHKLKEEYNDKTIIYADSSGANRVLDRVMEEIGGGGI